MRAEQITGVVAEHGEGPCWDERSGRLVWMDVFAGCVLSTNPATGDTARAPIAGPVAAFARPSRTGNALVVVGERDVQVLDEERATTLVRLPMAEGTRCNDGACDPQGRLYVGTLAYDLTEGAGVIFRISEDGEVDVVLEGTTISNGLGWSPDGATAYFVDSAIPRIDRFDFDPASGRLHSRTTFVEIDEADGIPDGLCVDAEGGVWVALWGNSLVRRYEPNGTISVRVEVPAPPVTACAFGGSDLSTLFITTSRFEDPHREPPAGALFACSPGVRGVESESCTITPSPG
jgi:sugar lactone lactonase YvrE